MEDGLIERLRKRAEIRRQISTRKSVQNNEPDRISDLLEEAANKIEELSKGFTKEQAIIVSGYTRFTACPFSLLHEDVEKRLGRAIWTHQFADEEIAEEIKQAYKEDFLKLCYKEKENG